jgi:cbb3-type cytochrome oxidase subunit 3
MSDEIWKTLIEAVTSALTMAMMFGFLAYLLHKDSQMWK